VSKAVAALSGMLIQHHLGWSRKQAVRQAVCGMSTVTAAVSMTVPKGPRRCSSMRLEAAVAPVATQQQLLQRKHRHIIQQQAAIGSMVAHTQA
jgi:hypothetical protein